ncbi:GntR family transcriptional regulator [Bosea sp. AK1]|jgi:GntR family transcriptional regulator|uniref:GntR family transcriptional regulator n=1 Tax=Bosea robiniae TaxID=1036780 RepID=A0ABY0NYH8_9HYPH|nr:GntR family transcriptional regulator [Bosea sp. AK1]SDG33672.1 GntR family transcriptional regulator [Bosea robiniae]
MIVRSVSSKPLDFKRSGISRYHQLATLFRRRIEAGQWQVGAQIPTVDELATECGVARATIRQALDLLEDDQLIERYRARGTFVRKRPAENLWCAVGTDWSGLLRPSYDATIEILHDEPDRVLHAFEEQIGTLAPAYRHVRRRHWRHGQPFLLADLHIDERLRDRIAQRDLESKTALRLISEVEGVEIADARQTLTIGTADIETSEALGISLDSPVAFVHRQALDQDGVLVLDAKGIYRGDVVKFDVKLR